MTVDDLVERAGLDLAEWRIVDHTSGSWTTPMRNAEGEVDLVQNWQVKARAVRRFDADLVRAPSIDIAPREAPDLAPMPDGVDLCVVIPDPQIGHRRRRDGLLEPLHDRRAMDVALQLVAAWQPEHVVCLGDVLDLAEMSAKFPPDVGLLDTTQASIDEAAWWFGAVRAAAPRARVAVLAGNHDERVQKAARRSAPALAEVEGVVDRAPALDLGRLLGLDALDIDWVAPYGAAMWLWDAVELRHGDKVGAGSGATVAKVAKETDFSRVFGHIHRVEIAHRMRWGPRGPRQLVIGSPGCMCRLAEGVVPGFVRRQNWQQGVGLLTFDKRARGGAGQEAMIAPVISGGAIGWLNGARVVGTDPTADIERAIGWPLAADWLRPEET